MDYNIETIETQALILRFLKGELSNKERKTFLSAMEKDQTLAKEVAINEAIFLHNIQPDKVKMKAILAGITASTSIKPNLETELLEPDSTNDSNSEDAASSDSTASVSKRNIGKWLGGFLLIGIGLIASLWLTMPDFFYFNKENLMVLAAKELHPLEDIFVLPSEEDSPLAQGMSFYNNGNYEEAIKLYKNHLSRNPDDVDVQLYMAVAQLFHGAIPASISNLEQLSLSEEASLLSHSSWYLSLAYLKNKQPSKAKKLLEQLKIDSIYAKQAQKLLDQL